MGCEGIQELWGMVGSQQQQGEGAQHCIHPGPGQTRLDWLPQDLPCVHRPGLRREREEEVQQQKEEEVEQKEDICSPPWWLYIACSGLLTVVVLASLDRTSRWLAPVPGGALSLPSHPHPLLAQPQPLSAPNQHSPSTTVRSQTTGHQHRPLPTTAPPTPATIFCPFPPAQSSRCALPLSMVSHPLDSLLDSMCARQEPSEQEKASLMCSLLRQSPPGELGYIVHDLCVLIQDDKLVRQEAACVAACHNKNNFIPIQINGHTVLLTHYNDLGGNRFFDPENKFSFEFDHLRGATSKPQVHGVMLDKGELWRIALHKGLKAYVSCHFPAGNCCVFKKSLGKRQMYVACIEAQQYQPSNPWNCLWKSDWTFALTPFTTEVTGIFLLQIHYFKDANFHISVSKSVSETLNMIDQSQFATDFVKFVKAEDDKFHVAILENIQALSEDIWEKNLRRKLPVTRTFMNWNELLNDQHLNTSVSNTEVLPCLLKHTI